MKKAAKIITVLMAMVLIIGALSGCTGDGSDNGSSSGAVGGAAVGGSNLIGKWRTGSMSTNFLEFRSDGTAKYLSGEYSGWEQTDNEIKLTGGTTSGNPSSVSFTILSFEGDTLMVRRGYDGGKFTCKRVSE